MDEKGGENIMSNANKQIALLSAKDVMKITGLSNRKVYQLFKQDDFASIRIGNKFFIKQSDFENWLEKQKK